LEPGSLSLFAVSVMRELEIDISCGKAKWIYDIMRKPINFSYVITICDDTNAERCPVFYGGTTRLHWNIPDPAEGEGTIEERLDAMRASRDAIRAKVEAWLKNACPLPA